MLLKEYLNGRSSAVFGKLSNSQDSDEFTLSFKEDISDYGKYNVVLKDSDKKTSNIRFHFDPKQDTMEYIINFIQEYFDEYNPAIPKGTFKVEYIPLLKTEKIEKKIIKSDEYSTEKSQIVKDWKIQLKKYKEIKYKSANIETAIKVLEENLNADPFKFKIGDGVGWKVMRNQINRGFRISHIWHDDKMVEIVQVVDTGLTRTGGNYDRIRPQTVPIGGLIRDRKYDI